METLLSEKNSGVRLVSLLTQGRLMGDPFNALWLFIFLIQPIAWVRPLSFLQAIVAVMRKLLLAIWGMLKNHEKWDGNKFYQFT